MFTMFHGPRSAFGRSSWKYIPPVPQAETGSGTITVTAKLHRSGTKPGSCSCSLRRYYATPWRMRSLYRELNFRDGHAKKE
jgi:hypothetical protein